MLNYDAVAGKNGFLATLNAELGRNYRLPTEAEWEYAARGCNAGNCEGYMYSGSDSIADVAWYSKNSKDDISYNPRQVGQKLPNALGIYDMTGNVQELCIDWYDTNYGYTIEELKNTTENFPIDNPTGPLDDRTRRSVRGGSVISYESIARIVRRNYYLPDMKLNALIVIGFRLVLPY
jgi:formylglycine-generating enzyme required for sulfatase activity